MSRIAIFLIILLSIPGITLASSVVRTGEDVSIADDQSVEGDFYGLGDVVSISGEVSEDLLVAASRVTLNGNVGKDFSVIAGTVSTYGLVGDDMRIIAGDVKIDGEIRGDLVVVAGSLEVLSTAKITGDLLFFGSEAVISGMVGKSVLGTSENIRIDGTILGDVDIKTGNLVLGERANVSGMVKYESSKELVRAQNALVAGEVVKNDPPLVATNGLRDLLMPLFILLFAVLVWYMMFGCLLEKVVIRSVNHPLRNMLIGFGWVFLVPIAVGILIMSTLGSLLGVTLLFIYLAVLIVSIALTAVVTGSYIMKLAKKPLTVGIPSILLGTIGFFILVFIPVIGPLVLTGLVLISLGAFTTHLYRTIRCS